MFAGTSTGAIIAGSLASKKFSVKDLIEFYTEERSQLFSRSFWSYPFGRLATKYRKEPIHQFFYDRLGNLKLEDCEKDILITATDTVKSETTYFSSFQAGTQNAFGLYRTLPLRHVMEASMSAPTYFPPHGRFIDGGVGVNNNPCYIAAVEAMRYSHVQRPSPIYQPGNIAVFSFGTGAESNHMEPEDAMQRSNLGWIDYVIGEGMDQANVQQSFVVEEELDEIEGSVIFYRYQVYFSDHIETRKRLGELLGEAIPDDFQLRSIRLDSIDEDSFSFLDRLGEGFGKRLALDGFYVKLLPALHPASLNQKPRGRLIEYGYEPQSDRERVKYLDEIRTEFDDIDQKYGL
jgi:hypothetical protein